MLKKYGFFRFPWKITIGNKVPTENILAGTLFLKLFPREPNGTILAAITATLR
jgi:hypothetical protein